MNELKALAVDMTEAEYHAYPAYSYSIIAKYARGGFSSLSTLFDKTEATPSMEFGSLFDCMVTRSYDVKKEYCVCDTIPPDSDRKVIDYIISKGNTITNNISDISYEILQDAFDTCEYYKAWKFDTKVKRITQYDDYFKAKLSGKNIISSTDWVDAVTMYKSFMQNDFIKNLFGKKSTSKIEYLYQLKFICNYALKSGKTVQIKIMPDLIVVNHINKTIQLVDLKTSSSPAWDFKTNFLNFRYDLQAHTYSTIIQKIIIADKTLNAYTVLPYLFVDISRSDMTPVVYTYDQTDISQVYGLSITRDDKTYTYSNWETLLSQIIEYKDTKAKVPSYIDLSKPNDLINILNTTLWK